MRDSRRNRRKNKEIKHQPKSDITKRDKIIALILMALGFMVAAIAAVYYSLDRAGLKLF